jgi:alpha-L-rhamnosidase
VLALANPAALHIGPGAQVKTNDTPVTGMFTGVGWDGHWIAPEPPAAAESFSFGGDVPRHGFSRVLYRRAVRLDEVPASVPARLTADSRYLLLVNGREVGRGPIRSQPRRLRYDEHDLAPFLVPGDNVIAVVVTYYGEANAFWQPAVTTGGLGTDALLVFEARLGDRLLVSDDSWQSLRSPAWKTVSQDVHEGVAFESLDARLLPADWWAAGFDDSAWKPATIVSTTHTGGFGRSQPPTDPYGALLPRGIGPLGGATVEPSGVAVATVTAPTFESDHPARRVQQLLNTAASPVSGFPVAGTLPADSVRLIAVDFGRIVAGFVGFSLDAPAGTIVDLHYREVAWDTSIDSAATGSLSGAQYIARGRDDEFAASEVIGLRYAYLLVHAAADAEVSVSSFLVREYLYPFVGKAFFRSSDAELDALYAAGVRTVALNSFDSFVDCPTREQRAWVGDGVVHQMVHFAANEDWRLTRNYIALSDSPRTDGILPSSVVGEIEAGRSIAIPDWSLHWVHGVFNLYRHGGDRREILHSLPSVERVLRWYEPYIDERGTISDVPEWNLIDWASVFSTGRSSIITALWARGLAEFAELCDFVGNAGSAEWARELWEAARIGYEDFWNDERGTYVDHFLGGERMPAASQAAGAAAIVSDLAPRERWSRIIDTITDEGALVVRSWIGGDDRDEHFRKLADQARGIQLIDWDVDTEIVIAEPFFSYVVHDAVALAGRSAQLPRLLRRWSQFLDGGYDTFGECWGWGTRVHGWSSTPARDLVSYVLGVTPDLPGFARVRVAPAWGAVDEMAGAVPTPFGLVTVEIDGSSVRIDSPVPIVFVGADGIERSLPAGSHRLDAEAAG